MKKMIYALCVFLIGFSFVSIKTEANEAPTYYKKKQCLFVPDSHCDGRGKDCGVATSCGSSY